MSRRAFKRPPPANEAEALKHRLDMAASAEGTTLGEWLYDALSDPFDFTGKWAAHGKAETRRKYSLAAKRFTARLAEALEPTP